MGCFDHNWHPNVLDVLPVPDYSPTSSVVQLLFVWSCLSWVKEEVTRQWEKQRPWATADEGFRETDVKHAKAGDTVNTDISRTFDFVISP